LAVDHQPTRFEAVEDIEVAWSADMPQAEGRINRAIAAMIAYARLKANDISRLFCRIVKNSKR